MASVLDRKPPSVLVVGRANAALQHLQVALSPFFPAREMWLKMLGSPLEVESTFYLNEPRDRYNALSLGVDLTVDFRLVFIKLQNS